MLKKNIQTSSFLKLSLWILVIYTQSVANNCAYGKELVLNDQKVFDFAYFLHQKGEYYRAISEYRRLQYFFPDSRLAEKSLLQIGKAYMAGGELREAVNHWQKQLKNIKLKETSQRQVKMFLGLSLLDLNKEKTYILRKRDIQEAFKQFGEISSGSSEDKRVKDFVEDWEARTPPAYKSPWIAGGLSAAIPGSGSFYTGRYTEGVYAFFVTSLFYLAAMDALRNQKKVSAYCLSFFTLSFYGGNIYTAVNGAHKINDKMNSDELLRLRKKYGIWFTP